MLIAVRDCKKHIQVQVVYHHFGSDSFADCYCCGVVCWFEDCFAALMKGVPPLPEAGLAAVNCWGLGGAMCGGGEWWKLAAPSGY